MSVFPGFKEEVEKLPVVLSGLWPTEQECIIGVCQGIKFQCFRIFSPPENHNSILFVLRFPGNKLKAVLEDLSDNFGPVDIIKGDESDTAVIVAFLQEDSYDIPKSASELMLGEEKVNEILTKYFFNEQEKTAVLHLLAAYDFFAGESQQVEYVQQL